MTAFKCTKHIKDLSKNIFIMKTIKSTFLPFLVLFIAGSLLTSCSKEDETKQNISENAKVSSFLKSFYSKNFEFGKSANSKILKQSANSKTVEYSDIVITEVFVGDDNRARGYVITSKDNNVFLYFVDVDRIDYKLTQLDVAVNEKKVFENIEQIDKYTSTNEFDFIKVTQELIKENAQDGSVSRIRYSYGASFTGIDGNCYQGVYQAHYFLGIRVSSIEAVQNENGSNAYVPCGSTYQP